MIASILASTSTGGIGYQGTLPWPKHNEDLKWFKQHTDGHIVIMGRRTWDDPQMPKPLPNRINCVFSTNPLGPYIVNRLEGDVETEIKNIQSKHPDKTVFIIGGQQLYESTNDLVDRVYLTRMKVNPWCDARINLEKYLTCFRIKSVRPGTNCTYEIWDRVIF